MDHDTAQNAVHRCTRRNNVQDANIAYSDGFDSALAWYRENAREFAALGLHPEKWVMDYFEDGSVGLRPHASSKKAHGEQRMIIGARLTPR